MRSEIKQEYTGVIILNYNNYEDTINCIESVDIYNTSKIKLIIVDNGSNRESTIDILDTYLEKRYEKLYQKFDSAPLSKTNLPYCSLIINNQNLGYACGNNIGLNLTSLDDTITHILILNNDVLFIQDIIPELLRKLEMIKDCAIISPALYKKDMIDFDYTCARMAPTPRDLILECLMVALGYNNFRDFIKRKYWLFVQNPKLMNEEVLKIQMPSGSCMLLQKDLFKSIGFFDPNTFLYFEENILFAKIQRLGMSSYLLPQLRCIHLGASSTNKSPSAFIQMCGLKSRVYYLRTYCNLAIFLQILLGIAQYMMRIKICTKTILNK